MCFSCFSAVVCCDFGCEYASAVNLPFQILLKQVVNTLVKARGYAYAKIEYVSVRMFLSKNRIRVCCTFRTLNAIHSDLSKTCGILQCSSIS